MKRVATIILGGGQGTRLFPLTKTRSKPAMSYGGNYRLIDIPISNALNSGAQKIFIITQFLSSSLHQHIFQTYRFSSLSSGFIELLPVEEKHQQREWLQGTADAVRQNLDYFIETAADYFLILSGDQLYTMDYRQLVQFAQEKDADAVIATLPVNEEDAKRMGVLHINEDSFITKFHEKPQAREDLDKMKMPSEQAKKVGIDPESKCSYLGSMGIYLVKRNVLIDLLQSDRGLDFGKHIIPAKVAQGNVAAYIFDGYWEDVGTVESFYNANMALTEPSPVFDCYNENWPIYAQHTMLPGARINHTQVTQSIICEGSLVDAKEVSRSIIGARTIIRQGTVIRDSYVMGNDYFAPPIETSRFPKEFYIGENTVIQKAIIDKHVQIGNNVQLINKQNLTTYDSDSVYIRDGIIIVARGATIPDGFVL
jgi:glucose-1-phosphate adenylyltransferase